MPTRYAFSLVELSIVLVILGLLVSGVLSGRSLIRAAELRAISTERERFTTAIYTFRDKYFALPGDINNAYQFWGATCGTNTSTASTGCNGDGNGAIAVYNEDVKVWEHLSRAGLIEGSYSGTLSVDGGVDITNSPTSKLNNGHWDIDSADPSGPITYNNMAGYVGDGALWLHFGQISTGSTNVYEHPTLTRAEAWSIDKKIDDGRANTGSMRGDAGLSCADAGTDYYDLAGTSDGNADTPDCVLHFLVK